MLVMVSILVLLFRGLITCRIVSAVIVAVIGICDQYKEYFSDIHLVQFV